MLNRLGCKPHKARWAKRGLKEIVEQGWCKSQIGPVRAWMGFEQDGLQAPQGQMGQDRLLSHVPSGGYSIQVGPGGPRWPVEKNPKGMVKSPTWPSEALDSCCTGLDARPTGPDGPRLALEPEFVGGIK